MIKLSAICAEGVQYSIQRYFNLVELVFLMKKSVSNQPQRMVLEYLLLSKMQMPLVTIFDKNYKKNDIS